MSFPLTKNMRWWVAGLIGLAAGLLLALLFFRGNPTVFRYTISFQPDGAHVRLEIEGWRKGASLRSFGSEAIVGLCDFRFQSENNQPVDFELSAVPGITEGEEASLWRTPTSHPSTLVARYRIAPKPIADGKGGWNRRIGSSDGQYAVLRGGHFLMIPRGMGCDRVEMNFQHSVDWSWIGPFPETPSTWEGERLKELARTPFVAGCFGSSTVAGTSWIVHLHKEYPVAVQESFLKAIGELPPPLKSFLPGIDRFETRIVLAPRAGDEITIVSSHDPRLIFLDVSLPYEQLYGEIVRHLVRSYCAPRIENLPSQAWFVAGMTEWIVDRIVSLERTTTERSLNGLLRTYEQEENRYDIALDASPLPGTNRWNHEKIVSTKAGVVFFLLEEALQKAEAPGGIAALIRSWSSGTSWEEALDNALGPHAAARWKGYLKEGGLPFRRTPPIAFELNPAITETAMGEEREVVIAFTAWGSGYLETCGCTFGLNGGLARRAKVLRQMQAAKWNPIVLELGNFLTHLPPRKLDPLRLDEQRLYVDLMKLLRTDAAVVGQGELLRGPSVYQELLGSSSLPLVSANIERGTEPLAPAWTLIERKGLKIGVLGYSEPWLEPQDHRLFGEALDSFALSEDVTHLGKFLEEMRSRTDLTIVGGRLSPMSLRTLLDRFGDKVDVILNEDILAREGAPLRQRTAYGGFVGRTLVLFHVLREQGISSAILRVRPRQVISYQGDLHTLDEKVEDDPEVRDRLTAFYQSLASRANELGSTVGRMFESDPWMQSGFVDESSCARCHSEEVAQWRTTKHAKAFNTLVKAQRQYHPDCVRCHVTGFGWETGYRMEDPKLHHRNVNCQVCHGSAEKHLQSPGRGNIRRSPDRATCEACHDLKHSKELHADFDHYWTQIRHR